MSRRVYHIIGYYYTAIWQLIKDTFNSPLLTLTLTLTLTLLIRPAICIRLAVCIVTLKLICTCYIEHTLCNFLNGNVFSCSVMVIVHCTLYRQHTV